MTTNSLTSEADYEYSLFNHMDGFLDKLERWYYPPSYLLVKVSNYDDAYSMSFRTQSVQSVKESPQRDPN